MGNDVRGHRASNTCHSTDGGCDPNQARRDTCGSQPCGHAKYWRHWQLDVIKDSNYQHGFFDGPEPLMGLPDRENVSDAQTANRLKLAQVRQRSR